MNTEEVTLPIFITDEKEPGTSLQDLCQELADGKYNSKIMALSILDWFKDHGLGVPQSSPQDRSAAQSECGPAGTATPKPMNQETKQLTAQQLALYLGCEAETKNNSIFTKGKVIIQDQTIVGELIAEAATNAYSSIKPLLRPLSDISEEEVFDGGFYKWKEADQFFEEFVTSRFCLNSIKKPKFTAKQFTYLLSRGFDLFGWCEAGLALDKTKTPTN